MDGDASSNRKPTTGRLVYPRGKFAVCWSIESRNILNLNAEAVHQRLLEHAEAILTNHALERPLTRANLERVLHDWHLRLAVIPLGERITTVIGPPWLLIPSHCDRDEINWRIAHAIGHRILHWKQQHAWACHADSPREREYEADLFAGWLLVGIPTQRSYRHAEEASDEKKWTAADIAHNLGVPAPRAERFWGEVG